ncbi:MAG TPA: glycosyltransferase family 4 protein [Isosphaeraceae bacterium]|nr:glycosyltransferase family 4 protein [Isosphaeraceae bacterium]
MKILHCAAGKLYGGVETHLTTLARTRQQAPGLESEFGVCFERRLATELRDLGVEVHNLGAVRYSRPWTLLGSRRRLREVLSRSRPDVLVCHGCWTHVAFASTAQKAGVPVIYWMHDAATGTNWMEWLAGRSRPDLVLANSRHTASMVNRLFPGPPPRTEILYYPVEAPEPMNRAQVRSDLRAELKTDPDAVVLVMACRFERWKGHTLLLDAVSRLVDRNGWVVWIAGGVQRPHEQVYLDELKAQAERLGISDRVRWLGQRSDVRRVLTAADLHCQPNIGAEPFGITFVEALYAGLPVVSTRLGGAIEIVDETCGVLVDPDNPDALAGALGSLLDDPDRRVSLGANGPTRAAILSDPGHILGRLAGMLEAETVSRDRSQTRPAREARC